MAVARKIPSSLRKALALLTTRQFGTFWLASLLSNIGTWAQQVAQPWLLLSIGATPFLLGVDEFAMDAPGWLFTLLGGVLADRMDRRRVIGVFQSIQMLCPILVVVLLATNGIQPWIVILLSLIIGITDALSMPSFQTIVPTIVTRAQIPAALALTSTQFNLSRILGPALAGVLITMVGVAACYVVSALSYLPFILVALWVLAPRAAARSSEPSPAQRAYAGYGAILRDRRMSLAVLTVLTTSMLCAPLITFCPVLVRDAFQGTAAQFSITVAAFGVGGVGGAIALLAIDAAVDRRMLSTMFAVAYAIIVLLASMAPWFWTLPLLLAFAGAAMNISNTSVNAVLLQTAEPQRRGQTISLYMLAMRGGLGIGGLLTGLTTGLFGVRHALLLNGLVALGAQLMLARVWMKRISPSPER